MFNKTKIKKKYEKRAKDIDPDEIFLDSENLPKFNIDQFEGRLEKPISFSTFILFSIICFFIFGGFFLRAFNLQVINGKVYLEKSENNRFKNTLIFSNRGIINDRKNNNLVWNTASSSKPEFSLREYSSLSGLSHILGYIKYPAKDNFGFYYNENYIGNDGVEKYYNDILSGKNGSRIIEVDANEKVQSESVIRPTEDGKNLKLSIDSDLQNYMYNTIAKLSKEVGFAGGAGIIMDVNTGEILTITNYPEYNSQILTDGNDAIAINNFLKNKNNPFLFRAIDGLYTPGSIIKPFISIAALSENIIDPNKKILSAGSISIPNIYDPSHPSIFKDWKIHGWVDMRQALSVSSDVYFYEIGGGYKDQKGLGINLIDKYMNMFGFGQDLPEGFFSGKAGIIPNPEWKAKNFNGEKWNLGNTYHTSIGQYGFQVSLIQIIRAMASIVNKGKLLEPSILFGGNPEKFIALNLNPDYFKIVKEGMNLCVEEGTAIGLNVEYLNLGAKTGTAQLGSKNQFVNSWVVGFFPYDNPKYAFVVIMEKGPSSNSTGGVYIMRQVFDWMKINTPEYLKS
ncbi:MAG: penicillin-binding transpeptidase domain-containing protein [bacterium]